MEGEIEALLKVSAISSALMAYARFSSAKIPPGFLRLLFLLPVISSLFFLPLGFSSIHLRTISGFFLAWLAVFKLLLLSFDAGPLSPSLPFLSFLPVALLPVNLRAATRRKPPHLLPTAIKALLFSFLVSFYSYRYRFPLFLLLLLYCFHIYLTAELVYAGAAFLASGLLGLNLEPQFDAPYRTTSLQDFWGRRWNLVVTTVLRPSVYNPIRRRWGSAAGFLATFLVSGVMHELMVYYVTLAPPTGEMLCFFLLHGVCTVLEVRLKKAAGNREGGWRVHPAAATGATLGFVVATGFRLFLPPMMRNGSDERVLEECEAMIGFFKKGSEAILGRFRLQ
ncbi:putative long-chain-alcohol O-fatty-acyltransferase 4 [Apostasia shenzhenica]|uniref:Putative long-chain-alcohol O-fatty-acyltransferase 4 n=1 Tax=Apostasia shenzhenica TaxID=1088818 RepID=A0A2I0AWV9_9ASPA|nr:putative long-chain-alcohol O-fatty-acyltransferase 4 [Apostasia shenzhenica]